MSNKELVFLSVDKLIPHPKNPRKNLGDLTELSESIKAKGVMQNLTVVPGESDTYMIVIGHRRHTASKLAGLTELPCVIECMSEAEQVATMLLENIQRSELTVYEQAQGFQMMIDLGETPESIAQLTGFSNSTVRRRLKMAELDQDKLKKVCDDDSRQIAIGDLDRLSQIKDSETKDNLLSVLGTKDFDYRCKSAIIAQEREEHFAFLKPVLKSLKAKKLSSCDRYSSKYNKLSSIDVIKFNEGDKLTVDGVRNTLYYIYEYGKCDFFTEAAKPAKVEKSDEEKERIKYIKDTAKKLDEIRKTAFRCRFDFVKTIRMDKKEYEAYIQFCALALIQQVDGINYDLSTDLLTELFGSDFTSISNYSSNRANYLREAATGPDKAQVMPRLIYRAFADSEDTRCYYTHSGDGFPVFEPSRKLNWIYDFLCYCGYKMSSDEKMLLNGTHPLFIDHDKKEDENK